jgi:predicted TIM-barrel fold metal-dependent hydrolase
MSRCSGNAGVIQTFLNSDRSYFTEHPQYYLYGRTDWPDHAAQLAARDRMLSQHPNLRFVGVHLASLEWDVAQIADFLDRFPTAQVDLAARMSHLQQQAVTNRQAVREFLIRYSSKILYGTDITVIEGQAEEQITNDAETTWRDDWKFLTSDAVLTSTEFDGTFVGLALPKAVVRRIYYDNAKQLFSTGWR